METAYRVSPTPKALSIQRLYFGANIIHGFGVMLCGPIFRNDGDEDDNEYSNQHDHVGNDDINIIIIIIMMKIMIMMMTTEIIKMTMKMMS